MPFFSSVYIQQDFAFLMLTKLLLVYMCLLNTFLHRSFFCKGNDKKVGQTCMVNINIFGRKKKKLYTFCINYFSTCIHVPVLVVLGAKSWFGFVLVKPHLRSNSLDAI